MHRFEQLVNVAQCTRFLVINLSGEVGGDSLPFGHTVSDTILCKLEVNSTMDFILLLYF